MPAEVPAVTPFHWHRKSSLNLKWGLDFTIQVIPPQPEMYTPGRASWITSDYSFL
jgi:hypothetical protein